MKKILFSIVLAVTMAGASAQAETLISGKEAAKLLGMDQKRHFTKGTYSVLVLDRHDRQPIQLDPIDAILFNPGGGSFKKLRTRDRDHRLLVNSPVGRRGEALTPDLLTRLFTLIEANHLVPHILKDETGNELLVVFTDLYNVCEVRRTEKGIFVWVLEHPSRMGLSLKRSWIWFKKY